VWLLSFVIVSAFGQAAPLSYQSQAKTANVMHTILGAGGHVSGVLTQELRQANMPTRLVSRRPIATDSPTVTWQPADLLNYAQLLKATQGATVLYLCPGLPYDSTVWQQQWPTIVRNAIDVAKAHQARLIFLDNVYMYGLVDGPMTETTPYNPASPKGEVQARTATMLLDEVRAGNIQASIARCPDFYGSGASSFYDSTVLAKFANGQRAQWLGRVDKRHSYLYLPDIGKAMYLLGQHPESDNQIWHLPAAPALTGRDYISLAAEIFGVADRYITVSKTVTQLLGLFIPFMKNVAEVFYQYDHDYVFNSDKFERVFNVQPTSYRDGVTTLASTVYKKAVPSTLPISLATS
jgi:nucleoside-diphosphate-sugar epimerase